MEQKKGILIKANLLHMMTPEHSHDKTTQLWRVSRSFTYWGTILVKCYCLVSFTTFEFYIFKGKARVGRTEGLLTLALTVRKSYFLLWLSIRFFKKGCRSINIRPTFNIQAFFRLRIWYRQRNKLKTSKSGPLTALDLV